MKQMDSTCALARQMDSSVPARAASRTIRIAILISFAAESYCAVVAKFFVIVADMNHSGW